MIQIKPIPAPTIFLDGVGEVRPRCEELADIMKKASLAQVSQAKEEADDRARLRRADRIKVEMQDAWPRAAAIMERVSQPLNKNLKGSGETIHFTAAKTSLGVQFAEAVSAFRFTAEGPDFSGEIPEEVTLDGTIKHGQNTKGLSSDKQEFAIDEVDCVDQELSKRRRLSVDLRNREKRC